MQKKEPLFIHKFRSYCDQRKRLYEADELFHTNEIQANRMVVSVLLGSAAILVVILLAVWAGIFPVTGRIVPSIIRVLIETMVFWLISRKIHQDAWWLRYILLLGLIGVYVQIDILLTHKVAILMVLPVLCATRYFSRKLTVTVALATAAAFFVSAILGAYRGWINMNDVRLPIGTTVTNTGIWLGSGIEATLDRSRYARDTVIFSYVPKLLMFTIASVISVNITKRGRAMVLIQKRLTKSRARIETELEMATQIQAGMLPGITPLFSNNERFDIFATMDPAREVGGDFYDFFLIDDDHLALVVADVSGKGVPAALFMMAAKSIIASNTMMGYSPAKVLEMTNEAICLSNPQEMFVTVWLGILDLGTGLLTASNAGHEYPAIKKGDRFELYKDKHGFVLGGMEGVKYTDYTLQLEEGDKLFLYTDGVPEATDQRLELFGTERMLRALNLNPSAPPRIILRNLQHTVGQFVGQAEQFDDFTMLCLYYGRRKEPADPKKKYQA